ncbi:MAG: hypothetical protein U0T02_11850 [Solirubrobacteraceae bacterium]
MLYPPGLEPGALNLDLLRVLARALEQLADTRPASAGIGELGRQLIAATLTEELILTGIDRRRLSQDALGLSLGPARVRFWPIEALAASLVESTATVPTLTMPASAQSASTS